jgi:hypothetical protein
MPHILVKENMHKERVKVLKKTEDGGGRRCMFYS